MRTNKNIKLAVVVFFAILLFYGKAEAVFSITLNYFSIDFGNMDSGYSGSFKDDVPSIGLVATCTTDEGNAWFLNIRNDGPLTHVSNPASVIPNTYFRWYGISTSDPVNTSLVTAREDFTIERRVYSGAVGEGASGTDITMKFELTLPPLLQSGSYDTNIVFTFTE